MIESVYLEQHMPSTLYGINQFGPEMVRDPGGHAFVLKMPAQVVRPFSNGGELIIIKVPWYPGSPDYSWSKAAKYLRVACPELVVDESFDDDD